MVIFHRECSIVKVLAQIYWYSPFGQKDKVGTNLSPLYELKCNIRFQFCTSCWSVHSLCHCWDWPLQGTELYKLVLCYEPVSLHRILRRKRAESQKRLCCPGQLCFSPCLCHLEVTGNLCLEMVSGTFVNSSDFCIYSKYFQLLNCLLEITGRDAHKP